MRIGILYNLAESEGTGKEIDEIAHNEIFETSLCVKKALEKKGHQASLIKASPDAFKTLAERFDFIFNLAEDVKGDIITESEVAAKLDKIGMPYTGSGEDTLRCCLEKTKAKNALSKEGILTPNFQQFKDGNEDMTLDFPIILKPCYTDGSLGIGLNSVVKSEAGLRKKAEEIIRVYKQPALAEEYIEGREINAAVIGNGKSIEVLPLSEIVFDYPPGIPAILTYEAKWVEDDDLYKRSVGKCPAELDKAEEEKICAAAKKAFLAMGCRDYARVDFRLKGNDPYVLEVNTKPCINPKGAGFIRSAKAAGFGYEDIIYKIFRESLKRQDICEKGIKMKQAI
ncbi:ATP-grasp domain-containing protein [Candidatus Woesearchaeota archaeon]|nr:ATP-grasp domain-containing protein [Candidatus Woesearchaeota archaeon]